ncbi:MAG: cytochrome c [Bacteroidetes bacterium]|nr:cytochrome c [Bacteroidota bacterium]
MKKFIPILLILSLVLNVFLVYFFMFKGETSITENDTRIAIHTSYSNKEFVMKEMRGFLESVRDINEGILQKNPEKIIKAAEKSGGAATEHVPEGLLKALPMEFKKLGFDTHDQFDQLAKSVKKQFNKDEAQQQVNKILYNCTQCHQSFKFEVKP